MNMENPYVLILQKTWLLWQISLGKDISDLPTN